MMLVIVGCVRERERVCVCACVFWLVRTTTGDGCSCIHHLTLFVSIQHGIKYTLVCPSRNATLTGPSSLALVTVCACAEHLKEFLTVCWTVNMFPCTHSPAHVEYILGILLHELSCRRMHGVLDQIMTGGV